jgi:hypothetical protein
MRKNWMTAKGADEMSGICMSLTSSSKSSNAGDLSASLHRAAIRSDPSNYEDHTKDEDKEDDPAVKLKCEEEVCSDDKAKEKVCGQPEADGKPADKKHECFKTCCESSFFAGQGAHMKGCFAGDATADVQGRGPVPLAELQTGDQVLVASSDKLVYEPILTFLHSVRPAHGESFSFITVVHTFGEFQATDNHIVFVAPDTNTGAFSDLSPRGASRIVGKIKPGDLLIVTDPGNPALVRSSTVLSVRSSSGEAGMYAPLTASGTIVVNGVAASNYASANGQMDLSHRAAHAFLLPVRLYHSLGLASLLRPFWQRFCGPSSHWLCHGDNLDARYKSSAPLEKVDQLHPYLAVMVRGLRVEKLLPFVV